jgi:hypothetical protein
VEFTAADISGGLEVVLVSVCNGQSLPEVCIPNIQYYTQGCRLASHFHCYKEEFEDSLCLYNNRLLTTLVHEKVLPQLQ